MHMMSAECLASGTDSVRLSAERVGDRETAAEKTRKRDSA